MAWDGKITNMKISHAGHPELHEALDGLNAKERSDRLRSLALLGLCVLSGRGAGQPAVPPPDLTLVQPPETHTVIEPKRDELKGTLFGTING